MFNKNDFKLIKGPYSSNYEYENDAYKVEIPEVDFNEKTVSCMKNLVELYPVKVKEIAKTFAELEWFRDAFPKETEESIESKLGKAIFKYLPCSVIISYLNHTIDEDHIIDVEVGGLYESFDVSLDG